MENSKNVNVNENVGQVKDGIINKDEWNKTSPKILFVLKEAYANDYEENEEGELLKEVGFSLCDYYNGVANNKNRKVLTARFVAFIAHSILTKELNLTDDAYASLKKNCSNQCNKKSRSEHNN